MTDRPRLILFDVDGTLVDSQADIVASMRRAFEAVGREAPPRAKILSIVGLSLDLAVAHLAPDLDATRRMVMVAAYKDEYARLRQAKGSALSSPLYPGVWALLDRLAAMPDVMLGVATGKSRRGLDALLTSLDMRDRFVTCQTADDHPSKPHPAMILAAMEETGTGPTATVMIGDTSFDMEMARAAGVQALGVAWGYHGRDRLGAAHQVVETVPQLEAALARWSVAA
ncbi:MAG: HAD family hydrolase [Rhodobacteraceae bacterium]|nr:MAG: HAD family hydrolase [Paracoccaceae bacterium]